MLLTVIIFLREVLEAALILSFLLAISFRLTHSRKWILPALGSGLIGGIITAYYLGDISNLLEGTGQEFMNASFLLMIAFFIYIVYIWLLQHLFENREHNPRLLLDKHINPVLIIIVGIAIMHEGCELAVYTYSFLQTHDSKLPFIMGGGLGLGIGASLGAIIYYLLLSLNQQKFIQLTLVILMLIAAGMASQAALYLIQSGWLPSQLPLWDTSAVIPEQSIPGQLLYALIGYESTPTLIQVVFYLTVFACFLSSMVFFMLRNHNDFRQIK